MEAKRKVAMTGTLAQLKALADPLRYQIYENLIGEARTPKQMAELMKTHPTRLYHHFHVLEEAGLIRPTRTQQKRGAVEKYFEAVVDRLELGEGSGPVPALLAGVFASTLADLEDPGVRRPYVKRYRIRATPERGAEIRKALEAVSELCEKAAAEDGGAEFGVTLVLSELER